MAIAAVAAVCVVSCGGDKKDEPTSAQPVEIHYYLTLDGAINNAVEFEVNYVDENGATQVAKSVNGKFDKSIIVKKFPFKAVMTWNFKKKADAPTSDLNYVLAYDIEYKGSAIGSHKSQLGGSGTISSEQRLNDWIEQRNNRNSRSVSFGADGKVIQ